MSRRAAASFAGAYDVVVLAKAASRLGPGVDAHHWVNGGGNLIAMAPDAQLAGLLGITPVGATLSNGYLLVDTSASAGQPASSGRRCSSTAPRLCTP